MEIVDLFYNLARTHTLIKGFTYEQPVSKGAGGEAYPLVNMEDPILGSSSSGKRTILYTVNVDILGIPNDETPVKEVQQSALLVGLDFSEQISKISTFRVDSFSFVSLREYSDNGDAGQRFTFSLMQANPVNRCAEMFDPDKQLENKTGLPSFSTDAPESCVVFNEKSGLPNFTLS